MRKKILIGKRAQIALFSKGGYIGVIWGYRKEVVESRACKSIPHPNLVVGYVNLLAKQLRK